MPILHAPGIPEFLVQELQFFERKIQKLVAYTVMPDHIHLIVSVEKSKTLSDFLRDFKKYTSRELRRRIAREGTDAPVRIWQPGTMDHCIRLTWERHDYYNHLAYLFHNSWKHLHIAPRDFPYHNFISFVRDGTFEENFFAIDEKLLPVFALYE